MRTIPIFAALLIAAFTLPTFAQNPPPPSQPGPTVRFGPGGGNFDPAAMRERFTAGAKTALACSDEEWKLLEPKLIKIILLRFDTSGFGGMVFRSRGGARGGASSFIRTLLDPNALPSQVEEKANALQQLLDNNETSTSAYTNALAQLRKAREAAKAALAAAQKDLASLLTIRQEALLVQLGMLE